MTANAKSAALRLRLGLATLAGLAATATAAAPPTPPQVFLETPSADELMKVYPPRALKQGVDGFVIIDCAIGAEGRLGKCGVQTERPLGYGFGEALISLSPKFRVNPTGEFKPGGRIGVPVKFASGKAPA